MTRRGEMDWEEGVVGGKEVLMHQEGDGRLSCGQHPEPQRGFRAGGTVFVVVGAQVQA